MTRVVLLVAAEEDLAAIYDYIADAAGARIADGYLRRLRVWLAALSHFPNRGTRRNDIAPGVRMVGFERRLTILFRVEPTEVHILRILYGGRDEQAAFANDD